jgi:RNA polymerase sigma factor (sigma-70 family)
MSLPLESISGAAEPSDAELIAAVRSGRTEAYGLLYERHVGAVRAQARQLSCSAADVDDLVAETFAAVFAMIKRGGGPHAAFRAYVRTTTRNRFYQRKRQERRLELAGDMTRHDVAEPWDDPVVAELDSVFAAAAFARLPDRWQTVLWLTEVEQKSPTDLAPLLGLTPNGVSALAYRAREGLRQAYLREHAPSSGDAEHDLTLNRLGAWVRGRLKPEIQDKVGAHLARCERCQAVAAELTEVNGGLAVLIAPVLLATGSATHLAVEASASKAAVAAGYGAGSVGASSVGAGSVGAVSPRRRYRRRRHRRFDGHRCGLVERRPGCQERRRRGSGNGDRWQRAARSDRGRAGPQAASRAASVELVDPVGSVTSDRRPSRSRHGEKHGTGRALEKRSKPAKPANEKAGKPAKQANTMSKPAEQTDSTTSGRARLASGKADKPSVKRARGRLTAQGRVSRNTANGEPRARSPIGHRVREARDRGWRR